jgi:maltooligosyltrehalose trehalohydrolase
LPALPRVAPNMKRVHRMPFGAEVLRDGVRFRVWAPSARSVTLSLHAPAKTLDMTESGDGWFEAVTADAHPGTRYRFVLEDGLPVPDPASRFNPDDVHGFSMVVDPAAFEWEDEDWSGRPWEDSVIYELHVGTFAPEGTFASVERRLDHLRDLGATAVELMPVADFPGRRNWGYDAVLLFAPDSRYGGPDDLKRLVQSAHQRALQVFLDVVYNHFGPDGNYLHNYAKPFFAQRHHTPWGAAINLDGPDSATVRDFFIHNALYWLEEFNVDGLRLDAVHALIDDSKPSFLSELSAALRGPRGPRRPVHLILENDNNQASLLGERPGESGKFEAQWNDDAHHAFHVLLTGEKDGYYGDYAQAPIRHLGRALTEGFAFQGEASSFRRGRRRGVPSRHLRATAFVSFLQNHDQTGNRALGDRLVTLAHPDALRAAVAILLLAPSPPLLFMGEEWAAREPFPFFCDFDGELARKIDEGRRDEFARFEQFRHEDARWRIPAPGADATFESARLDWNAREDRAAWLALYRSLLELRAREIAPRLRGIAGGARYAVDDRLLAADWKLGDGSHLHLRANLGATTHDHVAAPPGRVLYVTTPLPQAARTHVTLPAWTVMWSLEDSGV